MCIRPVLAGAALTAFLVVPAAAHADAAIAAKQINACFRSYPTPCANENLSAEFSSYHDFEDACGIKPGVRIDDAVVADSLKHNQGATAGMAQAFDGIASLCTNPRTPGAKTAVAAKLKSIRFTLVPSPPFHGEPLYPVNHMEGSELVVGFFGEVANVKDGIASFVFDHLAKDAVVHATAELLVACYTSGDVQPCLNAYLDQVQQTMPAIAATCGVKPTIRIDDVLVSTMESQNQNVASFIDTTLSGLTALCSQGASGKARVAHGLKAVRFTYAPTPFKNRYGIPNPTFSREGGQIVVTNRPGAANVEEAAKDWTKTNL